MRYYLANCRLFTGEEFLAGSAVLINNQVIEAVVESRLMSSSLPQVDCQGFLLCPGFVDLQLYGGGDSAFGVAPSLPALHHLRAYTLRHGTTSFLPTVPTNAPAIVAQALAAVRQALPTMPGLLGLHLEGPYISPHKRGVHPLEFIQRPTLATLTALLQQGQGVVRMLTVAPEVLGPAEAALLRASEVVLSAGHSNATYEQGMAAFQQGFTAATHLLNAMSPFTSRAPGLVGAIYDDAVVRASIVVDGQHCNFASVRLSQRLLGERLFLISDAAATHADGPYVFKPQGAYFVDAHGTLAGAGLTLLQAVRNCVEKVGLSLAESLRMASLYPARVLALDHRLGRLAPGYQADCCLIDSQFLLKASVLQGNLQWYSATSTTPGD